MIIPDLKMEKTIRVMLKLLTLGIVLLCRDATVFSAVRLPYLISDNMVIQNGRSVPIWGWADKDEVVTVIIDNKQYSARAGTDGKWEVMLNKLKSGQILEMNVNSSSGSSLTIKNILVGEVWICSGQSNMHWTFSPMHGVINNESELAAAKYDDIRIFTVEKKGAEEKAEDAKGVWLTITPENLLVDGQNGASAIAYFFGRELYRQLHIPIGLINASLGGTTAEKWTSREALEAVPELKSLTGKESGGSTLYNQMIAPLIPYPIRGAIWYQGEANLNRAFQYRTLFPVMIASWRSAWGEGDFPFGFVQLAPFRYKGENPASYAELCEAQLLTLKSVPNTGMVVTMDIGNVNDIHPRNKQEVGRRLALWALAQVYGRNRLVFSGPIYRSMTIRGNQIRLHFDHCGSGLTSTDGKPLVEFTIAGPNQEFTPAKAEIKGDKIVVYNENIERPVAVRYAWRDDAQPNLCNTEGLPASPFRTDSWRGVTEK
jgi:sialate O-acetylesterase